MLSNYETQRNEISNKIYQMAKTVQHAHETLFHGIQDESREVVTECDGILERVNAMAVEVDNSVIELLARFSPEAGELRLLVVYLKVVNNIVRVSDNVKSIANRVLRLIDNGVRFDRFKEQIEKMHRCAIYAFELSTQHLDGELDQIDFGTIYRLVVQEEEYSDRELRKIEAYLIQIGSDDGSISVEMIDVLHIVRKLERTADRAVDIARLMCYAKEGGMIESV